MWESDLVGRLEKVEAKGAEGGQVVLEERVCNVGGFQLNIKILDPPSNCGIVNMPKQ